MTSALLEKYQERIPALNYLASLIAQDFAEILDGDSVTICWKIAEFSEEELSRIPKDKIVWNPLVDHIQIYIYVVGSTQDVKRKLLKFFTYFENGDHYLVNLKSLYLEVNNELPDLNPPVTFFSVRFV